MATDRFGNHLDLLEFTSRNRNIFLIFKSLFAGKIEVPKQSGNGIETPGPTLLVPAHRAFQELAAEIGSRDPVEAAREISERLATRMHYDRQATTALTDGATALTSGAGVCQDFAHIMIGTLRVLGIPARYVGGYKLPDRIKRDTRSWPAHLHAWVAVEAAPGTWHTVEATAVSKAPRRVAVAWGRDFSDTQPLAFLEGSAIPIGSDYEIMAQRV